MIFLYCSFPDLNVEYFHNTFLLFWKGEPSARMWESWNNQMRCFDSGICSETRVSALAYFSSNTGFTLTPFWNRIHVRKHYGAEIIITNGFYGVEMWNEGAKKLEDYNPKSSFMPYVVGQRNDQKLDDQWVKTMPRIHSYTFGKEEEDGKIITEFFSK